MTRLFAAALALVLAVPAAADEVIPAGRRLALRSKLLGEERTLRVWAPPVCEAPGARCPVLYLTDGDEKWLHTVGAVDFLANQGRIPALRVVGIENTERTRDLTPTTLADVRGSGGAGRFLAFLRDELIPFVEKTYRTEPCRLFAGHSFGGLFGLWAFAQEPDLLRGVIAASPSLDWDQHLPARELARLFSARPALPRALFVTMASEGAQAKRDYEELRGLLDSARGGGLRAGGAYFPDEDHGSVVLRSHYQGLLHVFEGYELPRPFAGNLADLQQHYARASERFGYTVVPPEAAVNLAGYAALRDKRPADAVAILELNVKAYPESANAYDSYGEALMVAGRLAEAKVNLAKAVQIASRVNHPLLAAYKARLAALQSRESK